MHHSNMSSPTRSPPTTPSRNPTMTDKLVKVTQKKKSAPQTWLDSYDKFLVRNAASIGSIESTLRTVSYVLPGRFNDVEIATETLYAVLNVLGLYHDTIIARAVAASPNAAAVYRPSPHNRYTDWFIKNRKGYKYASRAVTFVKFGELVAEMVAKKNGGEMARWKCIIGIEGIKAGLRIYMLGSTLYQPLCTTPYPDREVTGELLETICRDEGELDIEKGLMDPQWKMPRTGRTIPEIAPTNVEGYLLTKVLRSEDVDRPYNLLSRLDNWGVVAELLSILRPLIYACLLFRQHVNKTVPASTKSKFPFLNSPWAPWIIGLVIEALSRKMMGSWLLRQRQSGKTPTALDQMEVKGRTNLLGWWLFRGEFYQAYTRPLLYSIVARLEKIPGLGLFGALISDYLYLFDRYYFTASTL